MARFAWAIWASDHSLQSLFQMGAARHLEGYIRRSSLRAKRQPDLHRQFHHQGSPRSGGVKKGELAEGIGRSRGGRTSKVHAAVDEEGRPLRLAISGGQLHDSQMMKAFLDWDKEPLAIIADKAYGSTKIRHQIADEGALAVIPSKSNARKPVPHDPNLYAKRNIVERFFCKMKDMRRLATRYGKSANGFNSMLYIFAFRCWAN
jgi:transposase